MKRFLQIIGLILVVAFIVLQLIPVDRTNPDVTQEVQWDSDETRALAQRACIDCHSNETVWPWYSYVAPVSFRVADHVEHGRHHLNFSTWDQPNEPFSELEEMIHEGEMPLWDYLLMHSEADLNDAEKEALVAGLRATFENDPPIKK